MSVTSIDVEAVLREIAEPHLVIIGAWHDVLPTLPLPIDVYHHTPRYLPAAVNQRVWCVEPMPHCARSLRALEHPGRVYVLPYAVSDRDGMMTWFQHSAVDQTNSLRRHTDLVMNLVEGSVTVGAVSTRRLDTLLAQGELPSHAHYVTLDVQGCAREAIEGGRAFFANVMMVWAEVEFVELYEGQALFPEVCALFNSMGFDLVTQFTDKERGDLWSDALFVRRN